MVGIPSILLLLAESQVEPEGAGSPYKMLVIGAAAVVLGLFLWAKTNRRIARSRQDQGMSARERVEKASQARDIYSNISELMARLADLSRQINGQIDTRTAKLEQLLGRADRAIEALKEAAADGGGEVNGKAEQATHETYAEQVAQEVAGTGEVGSAGAAVTEADEPGGGGVLDSPGARNIIAMAGQGLTARNIAEHVHRPVGEVELILSLAGKKPKKNP